MLAASRRWSVMPHIDALAIALATVAMGIPAIITAAAFGSKISINESEADRVRTIFRSYLRLGSLSLLLADLRKQGIVTKVRRTGQSRTAARGQAARRIDNVEKPDHRRSPRTRLCRGARGILH
jgi:hypothetical protein